MDHLLRYLEHSGLHCSERNVLKHYLKAKENNHSGSSKVPLNVAWNFANDCGFGAQFESIYEKATGSKALTCSMFCLACQETIVLDSPTRVQTHVMRLSQRERNTRSQQMIRKATRR